MSLVHKSHVSKCIFHGTQTNGKPVSLGRKSINSWITEKRNPHSCFKNACSHITNFWLLSGKWIFHLVCNLKIIFEFHWFLVNFFYINQQTNLPVFQLKESTVRRRYSDFEWLKKELDRDSKVCSVSVC